MYEETPEIGSRLNSIAENCFITRAEHTKHWSSNLHSNLRNLKLVYNWNNFSYSVCETLSLLEIEDLLVCSNMHRAEFLKRGRNDQSFENQAKNKLKSDSGLDGSDHGWFWSDHWSAPQSESEHTVYISSLYVTNWVLIFIYSRVVYTKLLRLYEINFWFWSFKNYRLSQMNSDRFRELIESHRKNWEGWDLLCSGIGFFLNANKKTLLFPSFETLTFGFTNSDFKRLGRLDFVVKEVFLVLSKPTWSQLISLVFASVVPYFSIVFLCF